MRRFLWLLPVVLLLGGCGEETQSRAAELQQRYEALTGYEAEIRVAVPRGDETLRYALHLTAEGETVRAEVMEPELLAGISARMEGEQLTLEYDGTILDAGTLSPRVSALNAAPLLLRAFPQGYLDSFGSETMDGEDTLRADFPLTLAGESLDCVLWFGEDGAPVYGEIAQEGKIIAAVEFTNVIFGDILSSDG